jgi:hypothetical protein
MALLSLGGALPTDTNVGILGGPPPWIPLGFVLYLERHMLAIRLGSRIVTYRDRIVTWDVQT